VGTKRNGQHIAIECVSYILTLDFVQGSKIEIVERREGSCYVYYFKMIEKGNWKGENGSKGKAKGAH